MVLYENYLTCKLINTNENLKNDRKTLAKLVSNGVINQTHIDHI